MQLTSLSLAISRIMGGGAWSPFSLFAAGEQGAWYDPSDLTTLYQDAAGTTPVTAVEQRVGLMLDKSQGAVLGTELVTNGTFGTDSNWTKGTGVTISGGAGNFSSVAGGAGLSQSCSIQPGWYRVTYVVSNWVAGGLTLRIRVSGGTVYSSSPTANSAGNITISQIVFVSGAANLIEVISPGGAASPSTLSVDNVSIKPLAGNHAFQATTTPNDKRPILSARVNLLLATSTLSTQTVTTQATSYTLTFTGTGTIALSGTYIMVASGAGTYTFTATAGSLIVTVVGSVTNADLRPANIGNNIPAYQRVTTATDYDTAGFPYYLKADGAYTSMSTNSINFSATNNMTVVSGVRKLSDAAQGVVSELSATSASNNGSFTLSAPGGAATNYTWLSKGTTADMVTATPYTSPFSGVLTGLASISGPSNAIRVNGTATSDTNNQGTGNYGNYPLYLFARNNASLFLNGYFYGAIIRGATTSGTDLTNAESYMNTKSGGLY